MSEQLAQLRTDLRDALDAAGLHAFTTVPEAWTPPGVFVGPDDPYLDFEGSTFGGVLVHHQLTVVTAAGTNDVQADALDDLVLQILRTDLGEHQVSQVAQPGQIAINGQAHLGVAIRLTPVEIRL